MVSFHTHDEVLKLRGVGLVGWRGCGSHHLTVGSCRVSYILVRRRRKD